jgi:hypothetical protein
MLVHLRHFELKLTEEKIRDQISIIDKYHKNIHAKVESINTTKTSIISIFLKDKYHKIHSCKRR